MKVLQFINRALKKIGVSYAIIDMDLVFEMVAMIAAYRVFLQARIEPHEVIVWDSEKQIIVVTTKH